MSSNLTLSARGRSRSISAARWIGGSRRQRAWCRTRRSLRGESLDRWPRGLRRTPGKCVYVQAYREFESHPIRIQRRIPPVPDGSGGIRPSRRGRRRHAEFPAPAYGVPLVSVIREPAKRENFQRGSGGHARRWRPQRDSHHPCRRATAACQGQRARMRHGPSGADRLSPRRGAKVASVFVTARSYLPP